MEKTEIRIAHSPDSDDSFTFYALATDKLATGGFRFTHTLEDIESLNQKALRGAYEVTAISIHAYAYIGTCCSPVEQAWETAMGPWSWRVNPGIRLNCEVRK
jgi:hypothetical protein